MVRSLGQPEWDNNDYERDFEWWGQPREDTMKKKAKDEGGQGEQEVGTNHPGDQFQKQGQGLDTVPTSDTPGSAGAPGSAPGGDGPSKDQDKDQDKDKE
jgi:hypothetical protein